MSQTIIVTTAGRAALVNANNTGTNPITIASMGITSTAFTPSASMTALPSELKRISALSGGATAADTLHLTVRDDGSDAYSMRGYAFYLADGTLFAIYGQADPIVNKTASSMMLLALDVIFSDINAEDLEFGDTNFMLPIATTTIYGQVKLATQAQANLGNEASAVLTPATARNAQLGWLLAVDGAGSGIDADLLDGQQGSYYTNIPARLGFTPMNVANFTPSAVLSNLLAVDGAGSGLDADLLDGQQGNYYAPRANPSFTGTIFSRGTGDYNILAATRATAGNPLPTLIVRLGAEFAYLMMSNPASDIETLFNELRPFQVHLPTGAIYLGPLVTIGGGQAWHAANDGAGSGLDADLLDGQQGSYYSDIAARLGFTPIQQGTGVGQNSYNAIKIGWSNTRLKATVDAGDLGNFVFDNNISDVWRASNDGSGSGLDADLLDGKQASDFALMAGFESGSNANGYWRKLPDGTIEQWGTFSGAYPEGAAARTFPIPFTNLDSINVQSIALNTGNSASNDMWTQAGTQSLTGFTIVFQATSSGNTAFGARWRAIGR